MNGSVDQLAIAETVLRSFIMANVMPDRFAISSMLGGLQLYLSDDDCATLSRSTIYSFNLLCNLFQVNELDILRAMPTGITHD